MTPLATAEGLDPDDLGRAVEFSEGRQEEVVAVRRWKMGIAAGAIGMLAAATAWAGHETWQGYRVVHIVVNGRPVQSDVPAINFQGRTLLPVRAVAEALGAQVQWDPNTWTATITAQGSGDVAALQAEVARLKEQLARVTQAKAAGEPVAFGKPVVRTAYGTTRVIGEVTNVSSKTASILNIAIVFYDAQGKLLGRATASVTDLQPGQTKSYEGAALEDFSTAATYRVEIDSALWQ